MRERAALGRGTDRVHECQIGAGLGHRGCREAVPTPPGDVLAKINHPAPRAGPGRSDLAISETVILLTPPLHPY